MSMYSASVMGSIVREAHILSQAECVRGAIPSALDPTHNAHMAKETKYGRTYLRAWRTYRGMTLVEVGDRIGKSHGQLSRIERGDYPYDQRLLEDLAALYRCSVIDLLATDPRGANATEPLTLDASLLQEILACLFEHRDALDAWDPALARPLAQAVAKVYRALQKSPQPHDRNAIDIALEVAMSELPPVLQ